jgi:hypothetical protein
VNSIADALAAAAALAPDGRGRFAAPSVLQSWPGIVHGGGLVAILDAASRALGVPAAPRIVEGRITSSVPLLTALTLEGGVREGGASVTILQDGQILSSASVSLLAPDTPAAPAAWRGGPAGFMLPMSDDCLACGSRNPLGLQTALSFDDEGVWARIDPRAPWRTGAALHDALAPVLLDEVAWWLGALTMREGGLTNRIQVTLHRPALPAGGPLLATGRFADVTPIDRRRTFWRTACGLFDVKGELLASAVVVFRGGTDYSVRQIPYFRERTSTTTFARMFPNYGDGGSAG